MSQLSRKISSENTGEHNTKSQKNSQTGAWPEQEAVNKRGCRCAVYVGAYKYGKCNDGSRTEA